MRKGQLKKRLAAVVDAYRWLWRAQRRWHPGPRWLAVVHFGRRVIADMLLFTLAHERKRLSAWAVVVGVSTIGIVAIALARLDEDRANEASVARWAPPDGGFEVAFPEAWESVRPSRVRHHAVLGLSPAAGASFIRAAGGVLDQRRLSAQIFELGEIPPGLTTFQVASNASSWLEAPHYSLGKPYRVSGGAYLTVYRFESSITTALIVLRGRNSTGFVIGLTGDRDDENVLIQEAHEIANAIRQEGRTLTNQEVFLHHYLDIPSEAAELTRHRTPAVGDQAVSGIRLIVSARLDEADTVEECRAGVAPLWLGVLGRFLAERHSRRLWVHELRLTCPGTSVELIYDLREHDFFVRQYTEAGALVYEKDMTAVVYLPNWGGNSIS